jgi:hypothetical protein
MASIGGGLPLLLFQKGDQLVQEQSGEITLEVTQLEENDISWINHH